MKTKNLAINLGLVASLLFCMAFACNDGDSRPNDTTQTESNPDSQARDSTAGNDLTAGKSKTGGSLAEDIIGSWGDEERPVTFTFGRDGSIIIDEDDDDGHQNGIYTVIDAETVEVKKAGKKSGTKMKVKINGDTMQFIGGSGGGISTLKRIS